MSKPLRLLVVEDSDADDAPLVRELRRHGYEPDAVHVNTADAMRNALQCQAWDVVIADHALPGFSSQAAVRVLQESGLDLPFIIVSETIGEEAAVTAMRAGAHDYVMKGHLTRLGLAVERELQEASVRRQRRKAEQLLAAQQAVTHILAEADTLREAGAKILQAMAETGDWVAGEIWTVDRQRDVLRCLEIWHAASKPLGEFEARSRAMTFARGVGLPGRVWASSQPAWIADVTRDTSFPRAPLVAEVGLRGAIGFPIVVSREVIGVIAFFRTTPGQLDEKLLSVLDAVGKQFGQFLVRLQAEEKTARHVKALADFKAALDEHATVAITDARGKINHVNDKFCALSKYAREELLGQDHRVINSGHHPKAFIRDLWKTITSGRVWRGEIKNRAKDGSFFWLDTTIVPFLGEDGKPHQYIAIRTDITERKRREEEVCRLNAKLAQQAAALQAANKELEAFSYSVSHDLRAPLRSLDGFSQALVEDYADKLDDSGQELLQRIRAGSQRMGQLIDGLLNLSRLSRSELRRDSVDLSALARTVASELQQREPQRQVEFQIADGLVAKGDVQLLRGVLDNLLGNAWKFTSKKTRAKIEFGLSQSNGTSAFFVRDNGAGFDMTYAGKLFCAFQRLHGQTEFEGIGIGLATVQRIIHRHGGAIRAQGAVGEGATFYFTLDGTITSMPDVSPLPEVGTPAPVRELGYEGAST